MGSTIGTFVRRSILSTASRDACLRPQEGIDARKRKMKMKSTARGPNRIRQFHRLSDTKRAGAENIRTLGQRVVSESSCEVVQKPWFLDCAKNHVNPDNRVNPVKLIFSGIGTNHCFLQDLWIGHDLHDEAYQLI